MNKAIFLSLLFLIFPLLAHSQQKQGNLDFLRTNPQFAQELKDLQELNLADIAPQLNSQFQTCDDILFSHHELCFSSI